MNCPEVLTPRNTAKVLGAALVVVALSACSTSPEERAEAYSELSPIARIDAEQGGGYTPDDVQEGTNCFWDTVYDPISGKNPADFRVWTDDNGQLVVTLEAAGSNGEISLTGFDDYYNLLRPADEQSRVKMDALGCFDE